MSKQRKPQLPKPPAGPSPTSEEASALAEAALVRAARVRRLVSDGAQLLAAKQPGEAVVRLAEAWKLDPQNAAAAINLGGAYILQGKHERAVPVLEAATRLEPDNAMAWSNLAAAYLGRLPFATRERQDRAIATCERALAIDPRAPHVHYNPGLIYVERNDPQRAATHFHAALKTDPTDRNAQHWLGEIWRRGESASSDIDQDA